MRLQGTGLPILASVLFLASATLPVARAEDGRATNDTQPAVQTERRAPAPASRLHPEACASLCRVFEFLGALERPAPPKPIPTS
jgi:hypothetical protein